MLAGAAAEQLGVDVELIRGGQTIAIRAVPTDFRAELIGGDLPIDGDRIDFLISVDEMGADAPPRGGDVIRFQKPSEDAPRDFIAKPVGDEPAARPTDPSGRIWRVHGLRV